MEKILKSTFESMEEYMSDNMRFAAIVKEYHLCENKLKALKNININRFIQLKSEILIFVFDYKRKYNDCTFIFLENEYLCRQHDIVSIFAKIEYGLHADGKKLISVFMKKWEELYEIILKTQIIKPKL